ncbi:MAG: threonylcarbamoyl-AMP synthase [Lachnospiraceae bacterium]|nr:threonylcarbamoyl-AMP synthase [Lachnospiraceae bacterium]
MQTIWKQITQEDNLNIAIYEEAGAILRKGGLVAFPTETVYGLGGNGFDAGASAKIYAAKGRPSDNPLILHISDIDMLSMITDEITDKARVLMDRFWPGPLTMIFNKKKEVPYETTGGLETVAVRMPDHEVARKLIEAAGTPIAAPSANVSGRPSPTMARHVYEDLSGKIDMILDGGDVGIGLESTIIDMTAEPPMILRPGYITKEMFEKEIGRVITDPAILKKPDEAMKPKAPGMKYRHYAPKAVLTLVESKACEDAKTDKVVSKIVDMATDKITSGAKVGIIATIETVETYTNLLNNRNVIIKMSDEEDSVVTAGEAMMFVIGSREDEESVARNLYKVLRQCDEKNMEYVYSETFSRDNFGEAIMNRLQKAAGYTIVEAD